MSDLFDLASGTPEAGTNAHRPLADRLRPATLGEVIGQESVLSPEGPLGSMLASGSLSSLILWGPPGVGKTTIARLLADATDLAFVQRLLEFEGIRYHFTHADGSETLVLSDDAGDAPEIEGDPVVGYSHADGLRPTDSLETIRDFLARQRLVTAKAEIKDLTQRIDGIAALQDDQERREA